MFFRSTKSNYVENIHREWENENYPDELSVAINTSECDSAEGLRLLKDLYSKGSSLSAFYLGDIYANARNVPRDVDLGFSWYEKAASEGSIEAKYRVAFINWYEGRPELSMNGLKKLSELGFGPASYTLGCIYFERMESDFDAKKARYYWTRAESQQHLMAKRRLSIYLRSGAEGFLGRLKGYCKLATMLLQFVYTSMKTPSSERLRGW